MTSYSIPLRRERCLLGFFAWRKHLLVCTLGKEKEETCLFSCFVLLMKWRGARRSVLEDNRMVATPPRLNSYTLCLWLHLMFCGLRCHMSRLHSRLSQVFPWMLSPGGLETILCQDKRRGTATRIATLLCDVSWVWNCSWRTESS